LLRPLLGFVALAAPIATLALAFLPLLRGRASDMQIAAFALLSLYLIAVALWRSGSPTRRGALFTFGAASFCMAMVFKAGFGFPNAFVFLLVLLAVMTLLGGARWGWAAFAIVILALIVTGALFATGVLVAQTPPLDPVNPRHWVAMIVFYGGITAVMIWAIAYITHQLETEIRKSEALHARLAQAQKAEALGALAGGMAHDFNNLLAVVLGSLQLARETPEGKKIDELLREAQESAQRGAGLTRDLLAFSRQTVIAPAATCLAKAVTDALRLATRNLPTSIQVEVKDLDDSLWIDASPIEIDQILLNLLLNARDAMPQGGRIEIGVMNVDGIACLNVRDYGVGMSEAIRARIFEPLFTTKARGAGTGLGLSVVQGLVSDRKGRIDVESVEGKGSTFRVCWPRCAAPEEKTSEAPAPVPRPRLLVAEDDPAVQKLLRRVLTSAGYDPIMCDDGEQALARLEEHQDIALVISDVVMPGIDGKTLHDRASAKNGSLRFLFCSGYSATLLTEELLAMPGRDFLAKPFLPAALLEKVQALLTEG
jgi:signal transduction histidine kinase